MKKIYKMCLKSFAKICHYNEGGGQVEIRGVGGVMHKYPDGAIKIGATQIRLDTRLLGGGWRAVLEEILSCG